MPCGAQPLAGGQGQMWGLQAGACDGAVSPAVILVGLLRYAHLLERLGPSLLNTLGLATGWVCAAGLTMVGNFQVRHLLGGLWGQAAREGALAGAEQWQHSAV